MLAHTSLIAALSIAGSALGQLEPEWIARLQTGSSLSAGLMGMATDAQGRTFVVGNTGPSGNLDILVAAFAPDGTVLWSDQYNGPGNWHDQARAIAVAPDGSVFVVGNTPGAFQYAAGVLLKYDGASGVRLKETIYSSAFFTSESIFSVAVAPDGSLHAGGSTVGDGGDGLLLSFTPDAALRWSQTWDGPAWAPYSQDHADLIKIGPDGNPVVMMYGVWWSNHPDFVALKLDAETGGILWQSNWGTNGGEEATDLEIDSLGDVYMTGVGINITDQFLTLKLDADTGAPLWQRYDFRGFDDIAQAMAIGPDGQVYVTGEWDHDGNQSNFTDNFLTIKFDAATGAKIWEHVYGDNCVGCYDVPADVVVDPAGNVFVVGRTSSAPYSNDMILFALDAETGLERERGIVAGGPDETASGSMLRLDGAWNLYIGGAMSNFNTGAIDMAVMKFPSRVAGECYADCENDADLDVFDFLCFQGRFASQDPYADCEHDADWDLFDFLCFQDAFAAGCR